MTNETEKPVTLITASELLRKLNLAHSKLRLLHEVVTPTAIAGRTFLYDPARAEAIKAQLVQASEGKAVKA